MPMSWAMNVGGLSAMSSEMAMKNMMSTRMMTTLRRSIFSETMSSMVPSSTSPGNDFLSR